MAGSTIRVRMDRLKLEALTAPGGDVWEWTKKVSNEIKAEAIATCPVGNPRWASSIMIGGVSVPVPRTSGLLKASHSRGLFKSGAGKCYGTVTNRAFYANLVHEGFSAHGPATANRMVYFDGGTKHAVKWVSGVRGRPWLAEAMRSVLAAHRVI